MSVFIYTFLSLTSFSFPNSMHFTLMEFQKYTYVLLPTVDSSSINRLYLIWIENTVTEQVDPYLLWVSLSLRSSRRCNFECATAETVSGCRSMASLLSQYLNVLRKSPCLQIICLCAQVRGQEQAPFQQSTQTRTLQSSQCLKSMITTWKPGQ
jgi:hypothetical protein